MKLYKIQPDRKHWRSYVMDASHQWGLPGVRCSQCGQTWSSVGTAYPLIDLSKMEHRELFELPRAVPVSEFFYLRDLIKDFSPELTFLPPGTDFGPLIGKAKGKFGDFAWLNFWTLLIQSKSLARLVSSGGTLKLPNTVRAHLTYKSRDEVDLLEFHLEPHGLLSEASYSTNDPQICSLCGRENRKVERVVINAASISREIDLFRLQGKPTYIIGSEKFVEVASELALTDWTASVIDAN